MNAISQVFGPLLPRLLQPIGNLIDFGPIGGIVNPDPNVNVFTSRPGRPAIHPPIAPEFIVTPSDPVNQIASQINMNPVGVLKDDPIATSTPESPYKILIPVAVITAVIGGAILFTKL